MPDRLTKKYIDLLTGFPFGCNSGVAPLLLPREQVSFSVNTTFRGGYATDRPPVQKLTLDFGGDAAMEQAFRKGFFQGCAPNGYRPDFGPSQNVVQISGRLFTLTENGAVWTVREITIPGDPNDATTNQVWMWQAEKWLIITDGTAKLPIFYDGVTTRRSYGPSVSLGTVNAVSVANPAIGAITVATMAAPYAGPFDVPVLFNGGVYQTTGSLTGNIVLTNLTGSPAAVVPTGTDVVVNPTLIGYTTAAANSTSAAAGSTTCVIPLFCSTPYSISLTLALTSIGSLAVGNSVTVATSTGSHSYTVTAIAGLNVTMTRATASVVSPVGAPVTPPPPPVETVAINTLVQFSSSMGPNVILGQLTADYTNPGVNASAAGSLSVPYTGPANQLVSMGTSLYVLNAVAPGAALTLNLINLSDTTPIATLPQDIFSVPEIPACRMGVYGLGQNWFSAVDGLSFGVSDLVGSSAGTQANNYRDAVLKTTDLQVMGYFPLPSSGEIITSMTFVATLDQALGQGPLQIGVASGFFSVKAPFTLIDFQGTTLTEAIANPILTKSLIGFGPVGQNSTILANSDTIFRSFEGVNSLILARRDFSDLGGNTPISREMTRIIDRDNKSLLSYSSAIVFDNRLRMTCAPNVSGQGVFHMGELVLNYDLLSSLRGKAQPVWDGLWTGTNILQYTQGLFGPVSRAFAFTFNITDTQIELYELLPTGTEHFDNGDTRIKWVIETPVIFNSNVKTLTDMAKLIDGENYLAEVNGLVQVAVMYRPIFYPCWIPWHTYSVCADMSADNAKEQVRYRLGLGEPNPKDCDLINNSPFRNGVGFQVRYEITGHCKFWASKYLAEEITEQSFTKPAGCVEPVCVALNCDVEDDLRIYDLDGLPQLPLPPVVPPVPPEFSNDAVYWCCPVSDPPAFPSGPLDSPSDEVL